MKFTKVPAWLSGSLVVSVFGLPWLLERRKPLRREVESKFRRTGRNLAVAGLAAVSLQLIEQPLIRLTVWDWLHGTLLLNVPQNKITIGVPAYRNPRDVELTDVVKMPFVEQRQTWLLPGAGQPTRVNALVGVSELLP